MVKLATPEQAATKKARRARRSARRSPELADEGVPVVAVDADLTGSTTTAKFAAANPDYEAPVQLRHRRAEHDRRRGGSRPWRATSPSPVRSPCSARAAPTIRFATPCATPSSNVKIAPTHAGVSVGPDGGSHQMLEDISLMRGLPGMRVLVPADYASARAAIKLAAKTPGPVYVRMGAQACRASTMTTSSSRSDAPTCCARGADVTIIACGVEIREALAAADVLAERGVSAEVIDAFSVKPLDEETILASVAKTGRVVVAEEHSVIGGLGSAVAELLAEKHPAPCAFVGMRDRFGKSGEFEELMSYFGLDSAAVVEAVEKVMAR